MTGLPTRLYFERQLEATAKKYDARSTRPAVLLIDPGGFEPVNDTSGHSSDDRELEQVGQRLKTLTRGAGVAARVGGDELQGYLFAKPMTARGPLWVMDDRSISAVFRNSVFGETPQATRPSGLRQSAGHTSR